VTSTAHHIGRPIDPANPHLQGRYRPWRAYGQAKLANFHFGLGLQRELEKAGAGAASLTPIPGCRTPACRRPACKPAAAAQASGSSSSSATTPGYPRPTRALPAAGGNRPSAKGGEFYGPLW